MIGLSLSLTPGRVIGGGGAALDPLTEDFAARLLVEGYTLTGSRLTAYDTFLKAGATNGWIDRIIELYTFEGTAAAHAKVKLIYQPATSSDLTSVGYVDGDVNTNGGMKSSTAGRYWTTINSNTVPNIAGIGAWVRDAYYGASSIMMGQPNDGSPFFMLASLYGNFGGNVNQNCYTAWGDGANQINEGRAMGRGFYRSGRAALDDLELTINGVTIGTVASAIADTRRDIALRVGESPITMDLGVIDDGLMTSGEMTAFIDDIAALMFSLNRLPLTPNINHTLILGQSLGAGTEGDPPLSTAPVEAYSNRQPYFGTKPSNLASPPATFGALFETGVETIASELANTLSMLRRDSVPGSYAYDLSLSNFSIGSAPYSSLAQGTGTYNNSITNITAAKAIADLTHGGTFRVPMLFVVHGETDGNSATYQADIEQWQADYETDIKAVTGQTGLIPMLHSQISAWTSPSNLDSATALSPYAVLAAHVDDPTRTVLVCPKYFLTYADGLHLDNAGYNLLAGYYGKAAKSVFDTGTFEPLRPSAVTRSGAVITLSFAGRVGSLVLDTTAVSDPGNYGFEWAQTGGTAATISAVALINSDTQVQITLSTDPGTPTTERVRYAYTGIASNAGGPTTGPRGCLRDSDTTENYSASALPNWCVHFDYAVGYADP